MRLPSVVRTLHFERQHAQNLQLKRYSFSHALTAIYYNIINVCRRRLYLYFTKFAIPLQSPPRKSLIVHSTNSFPHTPSLFQTTPLPPLIRLILLAPIPLHPQSSSKVRISHHRIRNSTQRRARPLQPQATYHLRASPITPRRRARWSCQSTRPTTRHASVA